MLDDYSYKKLKKEYNKRYQKHKNKEKYNGRSIQGCHSYDILANPKYFDDFNYIPVYQ